mmetsp:Transcript_3846/g.5063  ORF Transcript_3846/g.5063 Transcript_3846/m.5063 type:complete len:81 (+) Transcript_3846:70-312(+)|eukprot:CAMPEP_0198143936 /NCGR_PEP_ID=MMETSP1443-20131203/11824_1 /TAXON_ID=186043 /ORGANISM="Entomoneis sp., Strain CCMP2396" /LENGTH=80 /DNA_ID=CAMNT_0043807245 /DNA_START=64 /DNA_END=306 /DNA_ORIENTATION=-
MNEGKEDHDDGSNKRSKQEFLQFRGRKGPRVGEEFQVASLPSPQEPQEPPKKKDDDGPSTVDTTADSGPDENRSPDSDRD